MISILYNLSFVFRASAPTLRKPEESDEAHQLLLPLITSVSRLHSSGRDS
jgi:hypothetical protein